MQGVINVTAETSMKALVRGRAKLIGETMLRIASRGCQVFGQATHQQTVMIAGPGVLEMALELASEHYQLPKEDVRVDDQALVFFELGMSKLVEQAKDEGLAGLF